MTLQDFAMLASGICLIIGSGFVIVGVIGLLKFDNSMTRLHAPTKVGTVGIGMLLLASVFASLASGDPSMHELLIMVFLFFTTPVSAHFIAKVIIHRQDCVTPPSPPRDETWSTLRVPDGEESTG